MTDPIGHRVQGSSFPVNAYLIETRNGLILVDSTLTVSDGRAVAVDAVRSAASRENAVQLVTEQMKELLPSDDLLFLMQLSVPAFSQADASGHVSYSR